jgi:hypothetical protein
MEYNRKQQRKKAGFAGIHYGLAILVMGMLVVAGALGLARFGYGMILVNGSCYKYFDSLGSLSREIGWDRGPVPLSHLSQRGY